MVEDTHDRLIAIWEPLISGICSRLDDQRIVQSQLRQQLEGLDCKALDSQQLTDTLLELLEVSTVRVLFNLGLEPAFLMEEHLLYQRAAATIIKVLAIINSRDTHAVEELTIAKAACKQYCADAMHDLSAAPTTETMVLASVSGQAPRQAPFKLLTAMLTAIYAADIWSYINGETAITAARSQIEGFLVCVAGMPTYITRAEEAVVSKGTTLPMPDSIHEKLAKLILLGLATRL